MKTKALTAIHQIIRRGSFSGRGALLRLAKRVSGNRPQVVRLWPGIFCTLDLGSAYEVLIYLGSYEANVLRFTWHMLRPGDYYIDGGVNIGLHLLVAAKRLEGNGILVGFEPDANAFAQATSNLKLNQRITENVRLISSGLYSKTGELHFVAAGEASLESHLSSAGNSGSISVPVTTLDESTPELDGRFVLCKLDIEGSEAATLSGAKRLLRRDNSAFVCELNDPMLRRQGSNADELISVLTDHGFLAFSDEGEPITKRDPSWPVWKNALFLKGSEAIDRFQRSRESIFGK